MRYVLATTVWLLNLADLFITRWAISNGYANEVNPVMQNIVMDWRGAAAKIVVAGAVLYVLARRNSPLLWAGLAVYLAVVIYSVAGLAVVL